MLGLTIEEARRPTQLLKVSLTEGLLDDDVQEVLVHLVLLVLKLAVQVDQRLALNQNFDFESGIVINHLHREVFLERLHHKKLLL